MRPTRSNRRSAPIGSRSNASTIVLTLNRNRSRNLHPGWDSTVLLRADNRAVMMLSPTRLPSRLDLQAWGFVFLNETARIQNWEVDCFSKFKTVHCPKLG